ncbi:Fibronectin type III domain protein [Collimonas arenae]|uniref:Fibronectin type III domain protein n=1 Tax=Collimonas arenae TaxID=279058 RepID=A0A0A1FAM2_9BURK|nr:putative Ig domain-containing protein [Collimonas arenae]AIY41596.1 Fibronectin type III domain protein [Collimonas arenae]
MAWFAHLLRGFAYAAIFGWSSFAYAFSPSTECPPIQSITVASGGTSTTDLSGCSVFGLDGMPTAPSHGTLSDMNPTTGNGDSKVIYVNNGDGALSDSFVVLDDLNGTITFTVTVLPAASPITVTPATLPAPSIGNAYSQSLSASGGVAPYTYSLSSGSLPAGLSISAAGLISGTPTAAGAFTFTVGVLDSTTPTALSTTKTYSMTVAVPTMVLAPASPPAGTISLPYSQQMSTTGGTAPYSYAIQVGLGTLPPGLTLSPSGLISGTPTTAGSSTFSLKYTDSTSGTGPFSQAQNVTIVINASPVIVITPTVLPAATVAAAFSQSLSASGGTAPYTFAISAGALPAGLTLSSAGLLSGTPTAGGTFNFTVRGTDQSSFSGTQAYTLTVNAPTIAITPTTLPAATVATAYSQTAVASGGTAGYTYAISAGALPAGVTLSGGGTISGTPTAGGTFNFTVRATDSSTGTGPYIGARAYSMTVNAPTIAITPVSLPAMTVASSFTQNLTASGGIASYTYTVSAGALPNGLTLAANGTLSGTPTVSGPFNFTVTATDSSTGSGPYTGSRAYSVNVSAGLPVTGAVSVTVAYGSSANPVTLNLSGGTATSVAVASAAAHGTATASGTSITYTPTSGYAGGDSFTYTATNTAGTSSPATVTVTVSSPTLTITPSGSWSVTDGGSYSQTLTWAGGAAPYSGITVTGLPAGLSVTATSSTGATISGTPTAVGSFTVTASATDSSTGTGPFTKSQGFTLTVAAPTVSLTPPGPTLTPSYGSAFSQAFTASGGVAPYAYVLTGSLPSGLSWNAATATLSGTPTQSGSFPISVSATDHSTGTGAPFSTSVNYTLTVSAPTIAISPVSAPGGAIGQSYSTTISASGGVAPYSFTISAGALPSGVALNGATGALTGTPTAAGSFNFTVNASDANSFSGTRAYTVAIGAPGMTLTPASLPAAAVATAYSAAFSAGGGTAPYTYALTAGSLPSGISLNTATGVLSGTTVQAGSFPITVRATDSSTGAGAPFTAQGSYTLVVAAPTISLAPSSVSGGSVATSYAAVISASGGVSPYIYSISSGSLPTGVTLNASTGAVSGTPTAAGTFNFTVRAQDANSFSGVQSYSLAIAAATVTLNPATLPGATAEAAYSTTLVAGGGTAPYTYALTAGSLPSGISLNAATGVLSGTTVVSGSFPITVRATDSSTGTGAPFNASRSYTLTVAAPAISLAPSSVAGGTVAASYAASISASGGTAPYTYSVSAGALPAGISLNTASGALSGTPTAAGTFNVTVKALDVNGFNGTQAYSLVIGSATLTLNPATLPNPTAEAAYSATLTAGGGTAPYSFAVSGGALPTGLTLNAATGVLSGTTNLSGTFNVTISATDSSTGVGAPFVASHAYVLTVGAPNITLTPSTLVGAKASVAYSQQFTASGGIAPYAYTISAGSLPAGLALNAATGLLSGTPTAAGSFTFTVRATDAQNFTAQQAETLSVAQAQPVAVNDSASTPANQPVTVNVTANDSGPITSIAVSTPPAHGSAAVSGLNVVYTPAANYFGSDSLSYVATGPGGSSAPATVTVTVTALAVPVAVAQNATILAGQPVTLHGASGASGGPFTAVAIVSPPSVGTAAVSGTDIIYTSVIGSSGDIKFSYTLANAFGVSAPVTATVSVNPMPVVGAHSATVAAGAAVSVDLMAGASGGPFTAANLVTVSPTAAGSAVIRDVGSAGKPSYQMTFTASSKFAGAAAISYTLSNAYATSAPGTVTVTVTARRDMSTDPEVIGLLSAQADSARRFASAQISNFTRRLESLHGDGWGTSGFGVSLTPPSAPTGRPGSGTEAAPWLSADVDRMYGSPLQPNMRKVGWMPQAGGGQGGSNYGGGTGSAFGSGSGAASGSGTGNGPVLAANDTQSTITGLPDLPARQGNSKQPLSLWMGGAVDFGQQYVNGHQAGFRFHTDGVSIGGDYRINDFATFGIGGGFSRDSSDVGNNGTKSTAESVVGAMYGSLRPAKDVFIDGVLGYGTLNFNSNRYITGDGGFATGLRHGDQVFGAIVSGVEFHREGWMWSPYGRLELMSATLDQYTETASGLNALTYFKQTVRTTSGSLGVRAEGQYLTSIGTWVPRARVEFRHQFQGQDDAGLAYADLASAGPAYIVHTTSQDTGNWFAGIGARLVMRNGVMFTIDYNSNINVGNGRSQSIMFGLEVPLQ